MSLVDKRFPVLSAVAVVNIAIVLVTAPNYTLSANVLLVLLMVKSIAFVCLYTFRSNWRSTAAGRAVMGLIACFAAVCAVGTANIFFGDYAAKPFIRVASFVAVGLMIMNLLLTLVAAQRDQTNSEHGNPDIDA